MVFKGQSWHFRLYKWNICYTICYKTVENLKFTILKFRTEFKVVIIHFIRKTERIFSNFHTKILESKNHYMKNHSEKEFLCLFLMRHSETHTQILLPYLIYVRILKYAIIHYFIITYLNEISESLFRFEPSNPTYINITKRMSNA